MFCDSRKFCDSRRLYRIRSWQNECVVKSRTTAETICEDYDVDEERIRLNDNLLVGVAMERTLGNKKRKADEGEKGTLQWEGSFKRCGAEMCSGIGRKSGGV